MKIAFGCDHIVTDIKNKMVQIFREKGHEVIDCGTNDNTRTHYPIYGSRVARNVVDGTVDLGIVICGTGVGITTSATKHKNVRSVLTSDVITAKIAREKYDANICGLGGRIVGIGLMEEIIDTFINTRYCGENKEEIEFMNSLGREDFSEIEFNKYLKMWDDGNYVD